MVGTQLEATCDLKNRFFDFKEAGFINTIDIECTSNGYISKYLIKKLSLFSQYSNFRTWKTNTMGLCKNDQTECVSPKYPNCQDRTIQCLEKLPNLHETMDRHIIFSNVTESPISLGSVYSYTCKNDGFLIQVEGYPEEEFVECIEPYNYYQNWTYNKWKEGIWTNVEKITDGCFNPNLCYDNPPKMPYDGTVGINNTKDIKNWPSGTILQYYCIQKCI